VNAPHAVPDDVADAFLALYDRGLPSVYGYLSSRCGSVAIAEDLTSETFLAAVRTLQQRPSIELSVGWLITVARNKLVDHWRRVSAEERKLRLIEGDLDEATDDDARWLESLGPGQAHDVLASLGAHHRIALTLRYVDDLSVPEVADLLDRTIHATEALLVRARRAFRAAYDERRDDGD
jgi:RNA polymerase sigma-70 factor (ECF subfamily)